METNVNNIQKYDIFIKILLILFSFKFIYVLLEYFYNKNILTISTTTNFYNESKIEELNTNGHLISALGITLIITTILFQIYNKYIKTNETKIILYIITPFILYISSYNLLNKLVDYIVDKNINQSYNAYYLNIFKIGLLNNYFKYDSYVNNKNIVDNKLNMEEKLLFINSFVLLNYDNDLLNKLKTKGKENFINMYVEQHKDEFDKSFNKYMLLDNELVYLYNDFNNEKSNINNKLQSIDKINIDKEYNSFMNRFKNEYETYSKSFNKNVTLLNNEQKILELKNELITYLNNKNKYESIYRNKMQKYFGKYMPVDVFLDNNGNPNVIKIENVIKEESGNQKEKLSFNDFKITKEALKFVYDELLKQRLNPNINTDYTVKLNFTNLIENQNIKNVNAINKKINDKIKSKFENSDITLDMNYEKFINSNFIKNKIKVKLKEFNLKENKLDDFIFVLNSNNKENSFKNKIYFDIIKENNLLDKYLFNEKDFETNELAKEYGVKAIKLLYIPIFALSISLISLLLNIVSILSIIISKGLNFNFYKKLIFNLILISILISLPFINNININEKLLNKLDDDNYYFYFKFLEFIAYYEKLLF